jgi:tetratricopeptide (TPR) repeat protein
VTPSPETLPRWKRVVFFAVIVLIPCAVFVGGEVILRARNYGGNLDLVVRDTVAGRTFLAINRNVARRYFAGTVSVIPEPADDRFSIVKKPKTVRIFCLGESTMQGFPFEYHATPAAFLRDRLQAMLPDQDIEVVNAGLSAVGSFVVDDFVRDLVRYQPDLFVIYLGHNEFYGVYGVGSSVGAGGGALTRLTISLLRFKTFLFLRDMMLGIRQRLGGGSPRQDGTLMGQMVGDQAIPYNGSLYRDARDLYARNLRSIISRAQEAGIPIMFSALVSNTGDQKPFVALFSDNTDGARRLQWQALMASGDSLAAAGNLQQAALAYGNAIALDSMNASGVFALGQALRASGHFPQAKAAFARARDLDALRFRASDDFQHVLRDVCRAEGVPVAPVDSAFEDASPHGIPGRELFLEHLHPTIAGYFLMARTWAETIRRRGLLATTADWKDAGLPSEAELFRRSTVSVFDTLAGDIKIGLLKQRWPFTSLTGPGKFTPRTDVEALVYRYVRGKITWSGARYELAALDAARGDFEGARNECRAVARVVPFSYQPVFRIAGYYQDAGDVPSALREYRRSIEIEDNPFARMKIAILLLGSGNPAGAAPEIERALALTHTGLFRMKPGDMATAQYALGSAYAQTGRFREADVALRRSLAISPGFTQARELLARVTAAGRR